MTPSDLEQIVDRALKTLPAPRAPHTLLPAVMAAALVAAGRPWYARPWSAWPLAWQAVSVAAVVLLLAGGSMALPAVQPYLEPVMTLVDRAIRPLSGLIASIEAFMTVMGIVIWTAGQSIVGIVLVLFVVMLATSVAVGAAIGRVAFGGIK